MNCENIPIKFLKFYSLEALGNCQPDLPVVQRFIEHVEWRELKLIDCTNYIPSL